MTAIDANGQVYWTFDELDLDGALDAVLNDVDTLIMRCDVYTFGSRIYNLTQNQINKYLKVALYLERLKRGQSYV